jgi:hypothetical protein
MLELQDIGCGGVWYAKCRIESTPAPLSLCFKMRAERALLGAQLCDGQKSLGVNF